MNTALGDSSSVTDLLRVSGSTSGNTGVQITNSGGLGAQTTGDGIKLIEVAGASNGQFTQAGKVEAGAYQYTLYKGGVGADAADGNWYLRSTLEMPVEEDRGASAGTGNMPPAEQPVAYRPATVGYVMLPQLAAQYGFQILGRLDQRVGDVPNVEHEAGVKDNGVWGRIYAWNAQTETSSRFSADTRNAFVQFGKDWTVSAPATGGTSHAGITATFGNGSARFDDLPRGDYGLTTATGSAEMQVQALGAYFTRYLSDGSYSDSVLQVSHYHNRYDDKQGNTPGQNGFSIAVSEEIGKPFQIGTLPLAFEPQAQIAYQYLHLNGFSDNVSAISSTTSNALRGRVGFRLFRPDMQNASGTSTATPYLSANVLHDFLAPGRTVVGGTPLSADFARTWVDAGIGITMTFGKRSEVHAAIDYAHNLGGQNSHSINANAGYRYSW
ncbi:outer membrane autotransporter barrel domain protein [Burkholderia sp. H160]|nr:outer membrane autotransporter barrel domain protein [Burkholderia sp. H160]